MASDRPDPTPKLTAPSLQGLLRMGTMSTATDYTPHEREEYAAVTGEYPKPGDAAQVFMLLYGTATPSLKQRHLSA